MNFKRTSLRNHLHADFDKRPPSLRSDRKDDHWVTAGLLRQMGQWLVGYVCSQAKLVILRAEPVHLLQPKRVIMAIELNIEETVSGMAAVNFGGV